MSSHRWMKFWPQDWRRDPAVRMCSMAARGLWMEMLCVMHEAEPYGHLVINGRTVTSKQLTSIVGASEKEVTRLLAELEDAGVFSRTDAGVIYSRRMVRDHEASEIGKRNVEKRWGKKEGAKPTDSDPTGTPNRGANGDPRSLEERRKKKEPPLPPQGGGGGGCPDWEGIPVDRWEADPRDVQRPCVGGWYIDVIADKVLEAAGLPLNASLAGGFKPLAAWLRDGLEGDEIVAAIKAAAPGMSGVTASLARFDAIVRAACRRRGAA